MSSFTFCITIISTLSKKQLSTYPVECFYKHCCKCIFLLETTWNDQQKADTLQHFHQHSQTKGSRPYRHFPIRIFRLQTCTQSPYPDILLRNFLNNLIIMLVNRFQFHISDNKKTIFKAVFFEIILKY